MQATDDIRSFLETALASYADFLRNDISEQEFGVEAADLIIKVVQGGGWDFVHTTDHFVDIGEGDFAIQHATYCRPNMLDCKYTKLANQLWTFKPVEENGRYLMVMTEDRDGPYIELRKL